MLLSSEHSYIAVHLMYVLCTIEAGYYGVLMTRAMCLVASAFVCRTHERRSTAASCFDHIHVSNFVRALPCSHSRTLLRRVQWHAEPSAALQRNDKMQPPVAQKRKYWRSMECRDHGLYEHIQPHMR